MRRIGVDLGGTKIEVAVIDDRGAFELRERVPTPQGDYAATVAAICDLVERAQKYCGNRAPVGIGTPGSLTASGTIQNANSVVLNGKRLIADVEAALGYRVATENDANCLVRSECAGGAAEGAHAAFAAILGTGVGGAIAVQGEPLSGCHGIAGEWGHNPLPWPAPGELPGPRCYCGRNGCIETWLSGPALAADYRRVTGEARTAAEIVSASEYEAPAREAMERYEDRLARALATVINVLDPDCIVAGGGVSNASRIYRNVPLLLPSYVFSRTYDVRFVPASFGDSSGVRGAALLARRVVSQT